MLMFWQNNYKEQLKRIDELAKALHDADYHTVNKAKAEFDAEMQRLSLKQSWNLTHATWVLVFVIIALALSSIGLIIATIIK